MASKGKSHAKKKNSPKSLDQLARLICQEHERATKGLHDGLIHALRCGEYLREAKAQTQHGGWDKWVQENFLNKYKLAARTERKYRWFAKNKHLLPPNWQQTASFTWQDAERTIRKKGGKDDDPAKAKKGKKAEATADEKPKPPPLPPKPTRKHLEAAATVLEEKGIQADPAALLSFLEDLDVDLGPLLKKLEVIADQAKKVELTNWLTSHQDRSEEWEAVCKPFDVWSHNMAYAACRADKSLVFAWAENDDLSTRPGPEWCGAIACDYNGWPHTHFFVKADFDAARAARAGGRWLLEHGEAYEIDFDKATIKQALAAPEGPNLADAQPPVEPGPAHAAPEEPAE